MVGARLIALAELQVHGVGDGATTGWVFGVLPPVLVSLLPEPLEPLEPLAPLELRAAGARLVVAPLEPVVPVLAADAFGRLRLERVLRPEDVRFDESVTVVVEATTTGF